MKTMGYFVFQTEQEAEAAEATIVANVYAFASVNVPERVSQSPVGLYSFSAATGKLRPDACVTTRWAVPFEAVEGWVFPVPPDIPPMTSEQMTAGINAQVIEQYTALESENAVPEV